MPPAQPSRDAVIRAAQQCGFSGVVSVAPLDEGPSLGLAFGLAERGHRVPNTVETRFAMASGCKGFTAVAIGQLIDAGKIELDTPLGDCVPERRFKFASVTIGQLLNHTSGVPDYFDEAVATDFAALWRDRPCYSMTRAEDFLPLFQDRPMQAAPGGGFHYCNAGFILLGLAIEALTGRDHRDFIQERIFAPCGMTRTGYFAMDALPENTATGYVEAGAQGWRSNIFAVPSIGGADGGAFTTAGDLRRFWSALLGGRLLQPATCERFLAPSVRVPERAGTHYGYGFWLREKRGQKIIALEGADPGVALESQVTLHDRRVLTVLSNRDGGAEQMFRAVAGMMDAG